MLGAAVVKALEVGFDIVMILKNEGLAGLWEYLKEQFNDLKETVMNAIMDMIQSQVIQAGIKWILGLLSPVGAFIKACMAIIDVVVFFVQKAKQIMELIDAFLDSILAVASGSVSAVANLIENALARAVPVLIGFLASLLGLSGLASKVTKIFQKIQQRVEKAVTKLWMKLKEMGKTVLSKLGIGGKDEHDPEKQQKIDAGFIYLKQQEQQQDSDGNNKLTLEQANQAAQRTKAQHPVFSSLRAEPKGDKISYTYTASPPHEHETGTKLENTEKVNGFLMDNSSADAKSGLTITETREGNQRKGYKAKTDNSTKEFDGIIVGDTENAYVKNRKEKGDFNEKYNELVPLSVEDRRKKINAGGGDEHKDFKPEKIEFELVGDNSVRVSFKYSEEAKQGGASNFVNTFTLTNAAQRLANLTAQGNNLALKVPGTRGSTDSAGELAKKQYNIDLNSAHVLADWFLGSGYKESTNLLLTSKEFNQKTMAKAEADIQLQIAKIMKDNSNSIVTFDLTVSATFEALPDDKIIEVLNQNFKEMTEEGKTLALQKAQEVLQGKQDPRRCLLVEYEAILSIDGVKQSASLLAETDNEDTWLNELFN